MLEIRTKPIKNYPYYLVEVYFDGKNIKDISGVLNGDYRNIEISSILKSNPKFNLLITTKEAAEMVLSYPVSYFQSQVSVLQFQNSFHWMNEKYFENNLEIEIDKYNEASLEILPMVADWDLPYSINDYINTFISSWDKLEINKNNFESFEWAIDKHAHNFEISLSNSFFLIFTEENLKDILLPILSEIKECHETTIDLLEFNFKDTLISKFDFPKEIKVYCKQYLEYFAEFLRDLGINTTSSVKEEAGKVLFAVTPTDDVEALEKIREALALYLKLPESPIVYDDSFAAMRLQQQIENLQHSQKMAVREIQVSEKLLLAQSDMIREKNVTISQQQTFIENQNKIIEKISSKSVMMDSLENKAEFEKVFDGLEFGESKELKEKLGIKFNPITSIKSLGKKITGNDDEITVLNLNEET